MFEALCPTWANVYASSLSERHSLAPCGRCGDGHKALRFAYGVLRQAARVTFHPTDPIESMDVMEHCRERIADALAEPIAACVR